MDQSELEHRTSKARFLRTNGRLIPLQLSKIERRQRHIRAIRENLRRLPGSETNLDLESVADDLQLQYNIGKTENTPVHVPTFLQNNDGDPAIKASNLVHSYHFHLPMSPMQNFFSKLRGHLLPRILEVLRREAISHPGYPAFGTVFSDVGDSTPTNTDACKFVFLRNDRVYHHQLCRFHFTTYDVRRGSDTINPSTARCNIMLLADNADVVDDSSTGHPFLYARVLGVYHANIVYTGPGMHDYQARRLDFLWVRWYEVVDPDTAGWSSSRLDSVRFPPMNGEDAFGFVDPKDVLRTCHIIPNFAKGKRHADGVGVSRCAKDAGDYCQYYIGRYVPQYRDADSGADLRHLGFLNVIFLCAIMWGSGWVMRISMQTQDISMKSQVPRMAKRWSRRTK
jgi:hypothetical protein